MALRQYEPIWIKLKESLHKSEAERARGVTIIVNKLFHARVIKAVTKEKYGDLAFKIRIEPESSLLGTRSEGSRLTFTLKLIDRPLTLEDF